MVSSKLIRSAGNLLLLGAIAAGFAFMSVLLQQSSQKAVEVILEDFTQNTTNHEKPVVVKQTA